LPALFTNLWQLHGKAGLEALYQTLPIECIFLHRNEFRKNYNITEQLPAVFCEDAGGAQVLISKERLEQCDSVDDLKELILSVLRS